MSSPDERQGDEQATCSSYSCKEGPEYSISCDQIGRLRSESLEDPPPPQVPATRQSLVEITSPGGFLIYGKDHTEVPQVIEERQFAVDVRQDVSTTLKGCS